MNARLRDRPREVRRRAILVLPSGLTLGNLFFGFFAILLLRCSPLGMAVSSGMPEL